MPVLTVRAQDSATAMDEVIRRLGPDALILSTRSRDGQVEIVATDEPPVPAPRARPEPVPVEAAMPAPGWAEGFAAHLARAIATPEAPPAPAAPRIGIAEVLAAPRVVILGPLGAGKSGLALQLAAARLDAAEARGAGGRMPTFVFCGSGSQSDGGYLSQKAWLVGAEMVFLGADALPRPDADAGQIVLLSDLHPDPVAAARALLALPGAVGLLAVPAGLRAERLATLAARWSGLAQGSVLTLAPAEEPAPEDTGPLAAAGLAPLWTSRRGRMIGGLTACADAPADPLWTSRRARPSGDGTAPARHPETLTLAAG